MTADDSSLDDTRRELYAGSRATFVERRKELVAAARNGGDRDRAKLIGEMRKPTAAAHVVNLLAQAADNSLQDLIDLGTQVRDAMAQGDDQAMLSLLQGRPAAIAKVMRRAKEVARDAGESVSGAAGDQIAQTLRAAMASADAAQAVAAGTLTDALDEPGFEGFEIAPVTRSSAPASSGRQKLEAPEVDVVTVDPVEVQAVQRARANTQLKHASAEAKRAEQALATATKRRDVIHRERDRLASQLADIDEKLTAANTEVDDVEARLRDAETELKAATEAAKA